MIQGYTGVMIAAAPGTADTPRAHITNMAALECLRDIGLEEECLAQATKSENMEHTRWCYSMAGEEFARIVSEMSILVTLFWCRNSRVSGQLNRWIDSEW